MNHFSFELALLALVPGLVLCGYVLYMDRIEKEPAGLLALLFGVGAVVYLPSYFLQELTVGWIDSLFAETMQFSAEGILTYASAGAELWHNALCACFGFSLIQILFKWLALYFVTHKNKNFNYLFDGVVYSVFLSLGFAVAETLHFALENRADMLLAKLLTTVPCHLFVGILMGYYYTMWHMRYLANAAENRLKESGKVERDNIRSSAWWLLGSAVISVLVNSLYVFTSAVNDRTVMGIFYGVVFVLYGISFITIQQLAAKGIKSERYLCRLIRAGHPDLSQKEIMHCIEETTETVEEGEQ